MVGQDRCISQVRPPAWRRGATPRSSRQALAAAAPASMLLRGAPASVPWAQKARAVLARLSGASRPQAKPLCTKDRSRAARPSIQSSPPARARPIHEKAAPYWNSRFSARVNQHPGPPSQSSTKVARPGRHRAAATRARRAGSSRQPTQVESTKAPQVRPRRAWIFRRRLASMGL